MAYGAGNAYVANIHAFESSSSITLTASASPTKVTLNQNFTISGTLTNGTPSSGIAGATITLQNSTDDATWNNVTTTVTGATGNYQFSNNESAPNNYYYRTAFDGNATYASATSNIVNVNVYVPITSSPAVTAQNANSFNLFVNGTNGSLWYRYLDGHDLGSADVPRRECDVITRCHVTRPGVLGRLRARQQRRPLVGEYHK